MTPVLGLSLQLILVVTPDWEATQGVLRRFERSSTSSAWKQVGRETPIVVGRKGMGWGIGQHPPFDGARAPVKKEGDGKAPAGVFKLEQGFGYGPFAFSAGLPLLTSTSHHWCVDDVSSIYYNQIVDDREVTKDWKSAEEMRRKDELYRLGIVVQHNTSKVTPGAGSCIFMHVWRSSAEGTAGCTAMELAKMQELLEWLKSERHPVLVQLPREQYESLVQLWALPQTKN